jgi:hypothetical protein
MLAVKELEESYPEGPKSRGGKSVIQGSGVTRGPTASSVRRLASAFVEPDQTDHTASQRHGDAARFRRSEMSAASPVLTCVA